MGFSYDIDWDSQPLGVLSDREIERRLNNQGFPISHYTVKYQRRKRGISSAPELTKYDPLPGVDWDSVPLGQKSDQQIADEIGCTKTTVRKHRINRGIEAFDKSRSLGQVCRVDWESQPLGEMTDDALACKLGVGTSTVQYARSIRGIPPFAG